MAKENEELDVIIEDVEQLKGRIDELPDIGIDSLSDDVPAVAITKSSYGGNFGMYDVESIRVGDDVLPISNTVPIAWSTGVDNVEVIMGGLQGKVREYVNVVTDAELPNAIRQVKDYTDDFSSVIPDISNATKQITDIDVLPTANPDLAVPLVAPLAVSLRCCCCSYAA